MLETDDIKYIIEDLQGLLRRHEKDQEYEHCTTVQKLLQPLVDYLCNKIDYEEIVEPIYRICLGRYILFRLINNEGERYAVFLLPNMTYAFFKVPNNDDGSPSAMWHELLEEERTITNKLRSAVQQDKA